MKAVTGKLTAAFVLALVLTFFGCDSGVSNPSDNESSSSAGSLTESSSSLAPSSSSEEVSSSSSLEEKYSYCVFIEHQICLSGSFASCEAGGLLSNTCPYNNNGSSSSEIPLSSSSEEISSSSSTGSLTESSSSLVPSSSSVEPSSSSLLPSSSSVEPSSSSLLPSSSSVAPSSSSLVPSSSSEAIPSSSSQQVVISPPVNVPFFDDFEGTDEWTVVSSTGANYWMVGSGTSYAGSRSAYITNNGSDNAYTTGSASTSNIYREITFPSQSTGFMLSFNWTLSGQSQDNYKTYDYLAVYMVPSSVEITSAEPYYTYRLEGDINGPTAWKQTHIYLDAATYSGGTYKLVFHWRNTSSIQVYQPGAIDDVSIIAYAPNISDYKTVTIGEQVWMAEDLNNGKAYDWATAMALPNYPCNSNSNCASQIQTKHQGICPNGWHLPDTTEWNTLVSYVRNTSGCSSCAAHLKATSGWRNDGNGLDTYGFAALPTQNGSPDGSLYNNGGTGRWWSANAYGGGTTTVFQLQMDYDEDRIFNGSDYKTNLHSVRCVQD